MKGAMKMNAAEQEILQTCKERLAAHYGSRFKGLILYGSMARGTADPESDVDLLVALGDPFDYFVELEVLVDLLYDLQSDSNRYLSVRPASARDVASGRIQLYRNVQQEGIAV
jgi:uncharacterized protein